MNPTITAQRTCETSRGLVVRRRNQWGAKRSYTDENPINSPATTLFLHISVTNPSAYSSNDRHAQAIEGIGISRFPNTGISYNAGVMPNGQIYEFQPVGRRGAHTVNDFGISTCTRSGTGCPGRGGGLKTPSGSNNLNWSARAVVLCQNTGNTVTSTQVHAIAKIGAVWKRCGYVARAARWHGHRCVSSKSCPGDKGWAQLKEVARLTEHYYINGLGTAPVPEEDDVELKDNLPAVRRPDTGVLQVHQVEDALNAAVWLYYYFITAQPIQSPGVKTWAEANGANSTMTLKRMLEYIWNNTTPGSETAKGALHDLLDKEMLALKTDLIAAINGQPSNELEAVQAAAKLGAEEALEEGLDVRISASGGEPLPPSEPTPVNP
jgi:hypothetical protein